MTCLRGGGLFKHKCVANLLPSPSVKKCENWLIFREVIGKSLVSCFFDSKCSSVNSLTPFYRAMLCMRGTSHRPVSVCVCSSVTSRSSTKTAARRIAQTTPHDSPGSLVF